MEKLLNDRVLAKIFIGCTISSELRMHLRDSKKWKTDLIDNKGLSEIHYQGKDFIGKFLENPVVTLDELRRQEQEVRHILQTYCPSVDFDSIPIKTFPQVFIS